MRKNIVIISIVSILLLIFLIVGIFATNTKLSKSIILKLDCNQAKIMINKDHENRLKEYENKYNSLISSKNHLDKVVSTIEKKGFDITILKQKYNIFNKKVINFVSDYEEFLNILSEISVSTCNSDNLNILKIKYESQLQLLEIDSNEINSLMPDMQKEFEDIQVIVNSKLG